MANILTQNDIQYVDYKDIDLLKQFVNPHGRIVSRKRERWWSGSRRRQASRRRGAGCRCERQRDRVPEGRNKSRRHSFL